MKNLFIKKGEGENSSWQAKLPTKSGKFYLSIVAGPLLYSTPKEFLIDGNYSEVEVAIFRISDNGWATKEEASTVFPIIGEGEYRHEFGNTAVFPYVDINKIQECIDAL